MSALFHAVASSGRHSSTKSVVTYAPVTTAVLIHIPCHHGSSCVHDGGIEYIDFGYPEIMAIVSRELTGASTSVFGASGGAGDKSRIYSAVSGEISVSVGSFGIIRESVTISVSVREISVSGAYFADMSDVRDGRGAPTDADIVSIMKDIRQLNPLYVSTELNLTLFIVENV